MNLFAQRSKKNNAEALPFFLFMCVLVYFAFNPFSLLDFPLDDAWIHRVYSKSFAYGHGFAYNHGGPQEAGSTSPLWSIITAPAHWLEGLGVDAVVLTVKLMGILLALSSIRAVQKLSANYLPPTGIVIAASIYALDPRLSFASLSGMESILLATLWLWSTEALIRRKLLLSCILMSLTPTARPESLIILPFFAVLYIMIVMSDQHRLSRLWPLLVLPIPVFLWGLFCKYTNGHWLPTTFYAKESGFSLGSLQIRQAWASIGFRGLFPSFIACSILLFAAIFGTIRFRLKGALLASLCILAPAAFIFGVVCGRKFLFLGYYWTRWIEPPALILCCTTAITIGWLVSCTADCFTKKRAWIPGSVAALLLLLSLTHFITSLRKQRFHLVNDSRAIRLINVEAGKWIAENTKPDEIVAVNDAGAIRYFGNRMTIDLIGLNNSKAFFTHSKARLINNADWLAIFPSWIPNPELLQSFNAEKVIYIPQEEYTIIDGKSAQNCKVIYKRLTDTDSGTL